jgi:hypothetical protein
MTIHDAVSIAETMYDRLYASNPGDDLAGYVADAFEMVRLVGSPCPDSGNELRSTQVIAGIVVAYRMTKSMEKK